ncbi:hypothetical protein G3V86_24520, partial [Escherichia coli]|nr:hypothetical protein [Escherichia coli]
LDARDQPLLVPGPGLRVTPDADLDAYDVGDTLGYAGSGPLAVNGAFRIRRRAVAVDKSGAESVDVEFV